MIYTDFADGSAPNYGIQDNGPELIKKSVTGERTFRHRYVMYMQMGTAKDTDRTRNVIHNRAFQKWLMEQADAENFPEPDAGEYVVDMVAAPPLLVNFDPGTETGIYQLQFYIEYETE